MKPKYLMIPAAVALAIGMGSAVAQGTTGSTAGGAGGSTTGSTGATGVMAPKPSAAAANANANANARDAQAKKGEDKLARGDRKFIEDAAASNMFEMQAAQLAVEKSSSPEVKSFANELLKEHKTASQELQQIASRHQVEMPKELPRGKRSTLEDLRKQSGAEFDRTFAKEVGVEAHEDTVKRFQKASKDLKNPELKAWAEKTLPKLEEHLADARKLPQAGKESTRMGGPAADGKAAPKDAPAAPRNQAAPASGNKS
ncbi:DUF4142 domain-containing protein [Ramlibacter sp. AN1015]|uniref:DUF4142 domain-containing protein n=1 Tax=Ramlibacter sp. AN1015 TaxID=3133428 RepID=UPI0030C316F5